MNQTDFWTLGVIAGLAVVTVLSRAFFFISNQPWHLPGWAQRGLQYAPIAAMAAVIAPELLLQGGQWPSSWQDARWWGGAAGAAFYFWRRGAGQAVLGTIAVGMAVYLPLRLGLGW
ncbi:MAG: AzlD domain-containing protein [Burkholderiaceae bacterium]